MVGQATHQLLTALEARFDQQLTEQDTQEICYQLDLMHSYTLIFPKGGLILERDSLQQTLTQQRPWVVATLADLLKKCAETDNDAFQNQSYLLANLIPLVLRYFDTSVLNPPLRVFLALDAAPAYRSWLQAQLVAHLSDQYRVQFVPKRSECDLVVTNMDIAVSQPLISINTPPNHRDWATLQEFRI